MEREEEAACSWHNFGASVRLGGNKQIDKSGQQTALVRTLSRAYSLSHSPSGSLSLAHTLRDLIQEKPGEPAKH